METRSKPRPDDSVTDSPGNSDFDRPKPSSELENTSDSIWKKMGEKIFDSTMMKTRDKYQADDSVTVSPDSSATVGPIPSIEFDNNSGSILNKRGMNTFGSTMMKTRDKHHSDDSITVSPDNSAIVGPIPSIESDNNFDSILKKRGMKTFGSTMIKTLDKHHADDSVTDSPDNSATVGHIPSVRFDNNSGFILKKRGKKISGSTMMETRKKHYKIMDSSPRTLSFTKWDIFRVVVSLFFFFFDVVSDITIAVFHLNNGDFRWFTLTILFVAVPSLITTGFSLRWYLMDEDGKKLPPVSRTRWIVRTVMLLLQLGLLLRYFEYLRFGLKMKWSEGNVQKQEFYKQMIHEHARVTLLRVFECFLESAPQLILQMYIIINSQKPGDNSYTVSEIITLVFMFFSVLSISSALAFHQRALRISSEGKKKTMSYCSAALLIVWRIFDIGSRVLALGLFASIFPYYFSLVCASHYLIMFIWILSMKTEVCGNQYYEIFYCLILGVILIFCYFNHKDSHTRRRITFYYALCFVENCLMMAASYPMFSALFNSQLLCFFFGIVFMIMYYLLQHPTKNISVWDHWKRKEPIPFFLQPTFDIAELSFQSNDVQEREVYQ